MRFLRSLLRTWLRLRDTARHEFLRDPTVILFDRSPGQPAGWTGKGEGDR